MNSFFKEIAPIRMRDELAVDLGALPTDGYFEYAYTDAVKAAGHSCPAVAGAYRITQMALKRLYPDGMGERGKLSVVFRGNVSRGANGPISQVVTLITGAAGSNGFNGLGAGLHRRSGLLTFQDESLPERVTCVVAFTRMDTSETIKISYSSSLLPMDPRMGQLMKKLLSEDISPVERGEFARLWQDRVRMVLLEDLPGMFTIS